MRRRERAFTMIELMVVLAVLAVIALIAAPSFNDFILMQRLKSINAQLVTDMQFARSEAASRNLLVRVRFQKNASQSCYVIFTGGPSTCRCLTTPVCTATASAEIRSVQVPTSLGVSVAPPAGQVSAFELDPSTGAMSTGTDDDGRPLSDPFLVDTRIDTARNLRTIINRAGRPSVCSPTGSTMAVPACP